MMNKTEVLRALERSAQAYFGVQPDHRKKTLYVINDTDLTDIQCYIRKSGDLLSITFRGSDSLKDWKANLSFWKKCIPYGNRASRIRVHTGFLNTYKAPGIRDKLHRFMTDDIRRVHIAGHSYGAALSVLCAVDLQYNFPARDYQVIIFGCPRVGNGAFKRSYDKRVFKTLRVENGNDIVTKIPLALMGYRHVGIKIHVGPPRILGAFSIRDHYTQQYYAHAFTQLLP